MFHRLLLVKMMQFGRERKNYHFEIYENISYACDIFQRTELMHQPSCYDLRLPSVSHVQ